MTTVTYRVRLQEPTILTSLVGEPNSAVTYDYIPGSVIRGLIIGAFAASGQDVNAADEHTQRLFFNGQTRYFNAYIVNETEGINRRSLPSPLSWQKPKYGAQNIRDNAYIAQDAPRLEGKMKTVKDFSVIEGDTVYLTPLDHTLNVHNQRARRGGGEGTVYRYDALARGQLFEGLIVCETDADAKQLAEFLMDKVVMLGGARSAGYGQAMIESVRREDDYWEYPQSGPDSPLVLTCMSDVILRNADGEYQATLDSLLLALNQRGFSVTHADIDRTFLDTVLVGGFNRKWGLPLPQTPALKMGSVIVFMANADLDIQTITDALWYGLGERTIDGFGRIAVNWLGVSDYPVYSPPKDQEENTAATLEQVQLADEAAQTLWDRLASHRAAQKQAQALTQVYHDKTQQIRGTLPRTQLARLRQVIAEALRKSEPNKRQFITLFLTSIAGKYADKQYQSVQVQGKTLKDWLIEQVKSSSETDIDLLKRIDAMLEQAQKASKGGTP